jgi:hypothetical protein
LRKGTEEIVKLGDAELKILPKRIVEFICYRNISHLLYRPDVDRAVDSKLEDPEDDELIDKFMQCTQSITHWSSYKASTLRGVIEKSIGRMIEAHILAYLQSVDLEVVDLDA